MRITMYDCSTINKYTGLLILEKVKVGCTIANIIFIVMNL